MRTLSQRAAAACENATTPRCRCRCGGALHGAARGIPVTELPASDPHYAEPTPEDPQTVLELEGADELEADELEVAT